MRCEFVEQEIPCEMPSGIQKKYILCWISFTYSQKTYSMQIKRRELKTCIFKCCNPLHSMVLVLEHDELNLMVQVLEGHFSEKSKKWHCNSS